MTTFFRVLIMLALAIWLGGLFFFPFMAQIAFSAEASQQAAGVIVGACLITLHELGLACGLLMLVLLITISVRRAVRRTVYPAILLLLIMLSLTAVSQFWVIPHMETYRVAAGGSIALAPVNDPNRLAFEHLHQASVRIEVSVLFLGIALVTALAWVDSGRPLLKPSHDLA
jgi:hypothetical protein